MSATTIASFFLWTSIPAILYAIRFSWRERRACRRFIKQGLGLSPLPQGKRQRTIYSLYYARSGSDKLTVSTASLGNQSRRSEPARIMAWPQTIFMGFRGPEALPDKLRFVRHGTNFRLARGSSTVERLTT